MARVRLYLDEHVQASLAQGLRARGVDVLTTQEAGNSSLDDEGQLRFAAAHGRVLLSYNKRHFAKLHYDWMAAGRRHVVEPFGPNPIGAMMLDGNGRFSIAVIRPGLPKFASNNRQAGTADENKAAVQGSLAYFGTYSVSEADRMISMNIEGSTFPNWNGTDQKRLFTLSGDQLTLTNPTGSVGGNARIVWKRAK